MLLGERTFRLVRGAVHAEPVPPLAAKGKSEPVQAYRLLDVSSVGPVPRGAGTPFAGREEQLQLLRQEFDAVVARRECRLVTVVGEPGVGKSRLTAELVAQIGARARVVRGRCLSYGEGITFWAIGEIVRELAGINDEHSIAQARALVEAHVAGGPNARVVAAKIAQLLGLAEGSATAPETEWAIRHFLRAQADTRPLVVIVDDIHWAEPTLLGLLAGLPAAITDAPILLLCLARPELLEQGPHWQVAVRLEPLGGRDIDGLLESLLGDTPPAVRERLAEASAGNPLFAEELVAMLLDEGVLVRSGAGSLPPGRPRRDRPAGEPARPAQRPPRPPRRRGPGHACARRGRGRGLPLGRGRRALRSRLASRRPGRPAAARGQGPHTVGSRELRRRDGVPVQAHPRP